MEEHLNIFENVGRPQCFSSNGRRPQLQATQVQIPKVARINAHLQIENFIHLKMQGECWGELKM